MIEQLIYGFPSTVEVAGKKVPINTNWRASACLSYDEAKYEGQELLLFVVHLYFGDKARGGLVPDVVMDNLQESIEAAMEWRSNAFACMNYGTRKRRGTTKRIFSLDADIAIITSDFQRYYNIDLTKESMHWYRFVMLLMGLIRSTDTLIGQATSARMPIPSDAKDQERKRLKRLQEAWALPPLQDEILESLKRRF